MSITHPDTQAPEGPQTLLPAPQKFPMRLVHACLLEDGTHVSQGFNGFTALGSRKAPSMKHPAAHEPPLHTPVEQGVPWSLGGKTHWPVACVQLGASWHSFGLPHITSIPAPQVPEALHTSLPLQRFASAQLEPVRGVHAIWLMEGLQT